MLDKESLHPIENPIHPHSSFVRRVSQSQSSEGAGCLTLANKIRMKNVILVHMMKFIPNLNTQEIGDRRGKRRKHDRGTLRTCYRVL